MFEDQDIRQVAMAELLCIVAKAAHLTRSLQSSHASGHYTVSAFNGFHGCLFSARALMGLFGVFLVACDYKGREVNGLIDVFPWLGAVDQAKKFRKVHGGSNDLFYFRSFKPRIKSQDIWAVLARILRIVSMESVSDAERRKLQSFEYRRLSGPRNLFVYQGPQWTWSYDRVFEASRYFEPSIRGWDMVALLELAETEDFPEYILNGILFSTVEKALLEAFPHDAKGVISTLLFGVSPRESCYAKPPLSFLEG
ncbi:MAG: hypothetical protein M5U16_08925 [Hyphomicrobium sp.]|nr:hypothetical protein [Hyphomicrobium sp.]